jgi:hypothetical protein
MTVAGMVTAIVESTVTGTEKDIMITKNGIKRS